MTQFGDILSILAEIVQLRLTVDKGFYSATQEILQVEDVIFTWRYGNIQAKQGDYLSNFATIYLVSGEET